MSKEKQYLTPEDVLLEYVDDEGVSKPDLYAEEEEGDV